MTLTELQDEVYLITNRPDLADRTLSAIRAVTLKLHQLDFFYKDLFETGVAFSVPSYLQQIEYRAILPRYRALKYIRKSDASSSDTGAFLRLIVPEEVIDSYGQNHTDVCYVTGANIQIKSSTELQYVFLGVYLNPDITAAGFNSWLAVDHPYAIIYNAAAQIFKGIGKTEEFAAYTMLAREEQQAVIVSNTQAQGY